MPHTVFSFAKVMSDILHVKFIGGSEGLLEGL
jgi:hypothetical protein